MNPSMTASDTLPLPVAATSPRYSPPPSPKVSRIRPVDARPAFAAVESSAFAAASPAALAVASNSESVASAALIADALVTSTPASNRTLASAMAPALTAAPPISFMARPPMPRVARSIPAITAPFVAPSCMASPRSFSVKPPLAFSMALLPVSIMALPMNIPPKAPTAVPMAVPMPGATMVPPTAPAFAPAIPPAKIGAALGNCSTIACATPVGFAHAAAAKSPMASSKPTSSFSTFDLAIRAA